MASNAAEITAVEHEGNMVQFNMCAPVNGKVREWAWIYRSR